MNPGNPERDAQWLEWHRDGLTFADIARWAGVSKQRVSQVMARLGHSARSRSKLDAETVRAIRASTLPASALAAQVGVSPATITRAREGFTWKRL